MSNANNITSATRKSTESVRAKSRNNFRNPQQERMSSSSIKAQSNKSMDLEKIPTIEAKKSSPIKTILGLSPKKFLALLGATAALVSCAVIIITLAVVLTRSGQTASTSTSTGNGTTSSTAITTGTTATGSSSSTTASTTTGATTTTTTGSSSSTTASTTTGATTTTTTGSSSSTTASTTTGATTTTVVTTTTTTSSTTASCFYGGDEVRLVNGDIKTISELRSGMKVYSMNNENKIIEDEIIMILHREPDETDMFCVMETIDPKYKLSLTCDHYVAVRENSKTEYLISDDVKPNKHFLYIKNDLMHEAAVIQVKNVTREYKKGLYGLTTNEGTLIVNNIVASCYNNFTTIRITHNVLGLFRFYYKLVKYFSIEEPFRISTNGIPKPIKSLMENKNIVFFFHDLIINIGWIIQIGLLVTIGYFTKMFINKIYQYD